MGNDKIKLPPTALLVGKILFLAFVLYGLGYALGQTFFFMQ